MRLLKFSVFVLAIIITASCNVSSKSKEKVAAPGIRFIEDDWNLALKKAQAQNKLVFVDIYATWCEPCKMLKQYTFTDSSVGDFFNKNFINISIDGEKGIGPQLARQFSIEGYPTLIVADATGKPVLYTMGYISADYLLQFANEAVKKMQQQTKL
jgi:thiol:disulfide interchange protein